MMIMWNNKRNIIVNAVIFLAVSLVMLVVSVGVVKAQDAANYHSEYNVTNLYSGDQILIYHFTGLDPNENYIWLLQGLTEIGDSKQALSTKFFGDGVSTTHTITFSSSDFDAQDGTPFSGPARVIDNFGNVLGVHYILSGCFDDSFPWCVGVDWGNVGGNNALDQRVGIGDRFNSISRNAAGWFHPTSKPDLVLTRQGDITFLHYQFDSAILPTTELYRIYDIATGDILYEISLNDLYDYQNDPGRVTLGETTQTKSFVILNTNGVTPDWINQAQNAIAWVIGDNPHSTTFPIGAYDYTRVTAAGTHIDDGESVFLVGTSQNVEWEIHNSTQSIGEAGTLNFELVTNSAGIWESGYNDHELSDSFQGILDSSDYIYVLRRHENFIVSSVANDEVLTWSITPKFSNLTTATLSERKFLITLDYEILIDMLVVDRIENTLNGFGLDTTLGRMLAMLTIMMVLFIMVRMQGFTGLVPFALIFLMVGGGWLALGLGDTLTVVLFGIAAIILLMILVNSNRRNEGF